MGGSVTIDIILITATLLATARLVGHCGAHTAEPNIGLSRPIAPIPDSPKSAEYFRWHVAGRPGGTAAERPWHIVHSVARGAQQPVVRGRISFRAHLAGVVLVPVDRDRGHARACSGSQSQRGARAAGVAKTLGVGQGGACESCWLCHRTARAPALRVTRRPRVSYIKSMASGKRYTPVWF